MKGRIRPRACPRCKGTLAIEPGFGNYHEWVCVNCGYTTGEQGLPSPSLSTARFMYRPGTTGRTVPRAKGAP